VADTVTSQNIDLSSCDILYVAEVGTEEQLNKEVIMEVLPEIPV
jgi:hypothetical protein